ncbi:hypothetical protein Tco_0794226 [Tanacetum coccineum]
MANKEVPPRSVYSSVVHTTERVQSCSMSKSGDKTNKSNANILGGCASFVELLQMQGPAMVLETHSHVFPISPPTVPETITATDKARDSLVITPLHDDPYMLVRQAYTPIATDIESEPFEDPIETEETQPLSHRPVPLSPDYTLVSPDYTLDTPHSNEDSESIKASETKIASPLGSTSPLSPDHILTQTSPTSTPLQAFYYCSIARMVVRTQPTLSPNISARVTEAMALSPSSFYKRPRDMNLEAEPASSLTLPIQKRVRGYGTARRRVLKLAEGPTPNTFEVGQSSRNVSDWQTADEITTTRLPVCATWEDLVDVTVYTDIKSVMPLVRALIQTLTSPEWSSGSLPVSPASLIVPSPAASPETTPSTTIAVEEDEFLEAEAQLELNGKAVRDEIHSQRFRLWSLERAQEQATIIFGALWYEDQREILALRMQYTADQREMQGLRERVATLERRMDRVER